MINVPNISYQIAIEFIDIVPELQHYCESFCKSSRLNYPNKHNFHPSHLNAVVVKRLCVNKLDVLC